jgi:hypothetical protein
MHVVTWRTAKLISALSNPIVLSLPCVAAVSWQASSCWAERLRWWGIASLAISFTPFVHIRWGVRTGRLSDHHISIRQERLLPYLTELSAVCCAYLLMRALRAPRLMSGLVLSVAAGMVIVSGVTIAWKISMHVTGAAGTVMILVLLSDHRWAPLFLLVPVVGWSRHVLEHHTVTQVAAGALLGAVTPLVVFHLMGLPERAAQPRP